MQAAAGQHYLLPPYIRPARVEWITQQRPPDIPAQVACGPKSHGPARSAAAWCGSGRWNELPGGAMPAGGAGESAARPAARRDLLRIGALQGFDRTAQSLPPGRGAQDVRTHAALQAG